MEQIEEETAHFRAIENQRERNRKGLGSQYSFPVNAPNDLMSPSPVRPQAKNWAFNTQVFRGCLSKLYLEAF